MRNAVKSFSTVSIHWAGRSDKAEILRIERASFEFAWNESILVSFLKQKNASAFVAKHDDRIVGFVLAEKVDNFIHIVNIAVEPEMRGCGVGTQLVQRLIELLGVNTDRISVEVRETNVASQMFFKSLEFRCVKLEKNYYEEVDESALMFEYRLDWSADGIEVLKSIMQGDGRVVA